MLPSPAPASLEAPVNSGLDGVIAATSRLSRVDGEAGRLLVAGEDVRDLARSATFAEVASRLLVLGGSPSFDPPTLGAARHHAWSHLDRARPALARPEGLGALRAGLDLLLPDDAAPVEILGALPVLLAAWLRRRSAGALPPPDPDASQAEDLVRLGLGLEAPAALAPRARALEAYLVAVCDHGLNASTFTARVVASTGASGLSAVVAALGALSGPLHGGAPGPVLDMLDAVGEPEAAPAWIRAELDAGRRIMGLGHRVYRVRDPRAAVLEAAADSLAAEGIGGARRDLARAVEAAAVGILAERKPGRGLHANVELGTAVLLDAVGFPREAFTLLFACSRAAGWLAHAAEQRATGRLMRPRLRYVGVDPDARG